MKVPALGWAVLTVAVIALIGYALNRGLHIGSTIDVSTRQGEGKFLYSKSCRYLYLDGVHNVTSGSESSSREDSEKVSCALLGSAN
jgi:hypothetical protein